MLIFKILSSFVLLPLLFLGIAVTADNVDLGIQKDFEYQGGKVDIQSYSGWVKWYDQTDLQSLTNSQLLNFAKLAYDRMVVLHRSSLQDSDARPGAMAVLTIGEDMFFASSMRSQYYVWYNGGNSLLKEYLRNCQQLSDSVHRLRLASGEPNVLDVAMLARNGQTDFSEGRLAIWGTYSGLGNEVCLAPCSTNAGGYGCMTLISQFRISNWVPSATTPDGTDGNQWASKFQVKIPYDRDCP
jgi:hypothetical protein